MIGIYKITNIKTGQVYIGQSKTIIDRWKQHTKYASTAISIAEDDWHFDLAEHPEDYVFQILEQCSVEQLNEKEAYYISQEQAYLQGLNRNSGNFSNDAEVKGQLREQREKVKEIFNNSHLQDIAEKYKGLPLTQERRKQLRDECLPYIRTKTGRIPSGMKTIYGKFREYGYTLKEMVIGKKHIKQCGCSPEDIGHHCVIILDKKK